jgi:hypothetical protein
MCAKLLDVLAALEVKAVKEEKAAAFNTTIAKVEIAKFFKLLKVDPKAVSERSKDTIEVIKQIESSDAVCLGKIKEDGISIPEAIRIPETPAIQQTAVPNAIEEAIKNRIAQLQAEIKRREDETAARNQAHEQRRQELERTIEEQNRKQKESIDALMADQSKKNDDLLKRFEDLQAQKEKDKEKDAQPETKPTQPQVTQAPSASNEGPKMDKQEQPYNDPRNQQQQMGPMMLPATPSQVQTAPPTTMSPVSEADREARRAQRDRDDLKSAKASMDVDAWLNNLLLQNQIATAQQQQMQNQIQRGGSRFGTQSGRFGGATNMLGGGFGQTRGSRVGNFGTGVQQTGQYAPTF